MNQYSTSGMSLDRLKRIDSFIQEKYLNTNRFVGTLTGIFRKGSLVHCSALGLMDRERNKPVSRDTIFRIYSMTKPIVSVALMKLFERGCFQLDDPVKKYIPEFSDLRVYASGVYPNFDTSPPDRLMTVRDLLTHQSGLSYGQTSKSEVDKAYRFIGIGREHQKTLQEMVKSLSSLPLEFSPGRKWNYSVSTDVCGYLIEVISGISLDNFLEQEIFTPLDMTDTGFYVPKENLGRLAANYQYQLSGLPKLVDDPFTGDYSSKPTLLSGGGGLVSTMDDYMKFCEMILSNGTYKDKRILSRKTIELMSQNHLSSKGDLTSVALGRWSETAFSGVGFGLGFAVLIDPTAAQIPGSVGSLDWGGAASTAFWIDPVEDLAVVFLTQLRPSTIFNIRRELRTLVYSAIDD